jgi:hypothetical protein
MTVTIRLSAEEERQLLERAAMHGQDVASYVHRLIENDIQTSTTADDALAPFRRQVAESGLSDDELEDLFEQARDEVWQAKQGHQDEIR